MQVYLNELRGVSFDESGEPIELRQEENRITDLYDLKKSSIIQELIGLCTYPDRYSLGLAEAVPAALEVAPKDMLTLGEWLDEQGYILDKPAKHLLARIVQRRYKEAFGTVPRKIARRSPNTGQWSTRASGFEPTQIYILQAATDELLGLKGLTYEDLGTDAAMRAGFRLREKGKLSEYISEEIGQEAD